MQIQLNALADMVSVTLTSDSGHTYTVKLSEQSVTVNVVGEIVSISTNKPVKDEGQ